MNLWINPPLPPIAFLPASKERDPHACPMCGHPLTDAQVSNMEPLCFAFFCAKCFLMYGVLQGIVGRD